MSTVEPVAGQQSKPKRKQSGLGIASFIISLLDGLVVLVMLCIAIWMRTNGGSLNRSGQTIFTTVFSAVGVILLIAFGLGIASMFSKGKRKIFPVLALILQLGILILSVVTITLAVMG